MLSILGIILRVLVFFIIAILILGVLLMSIRAGVEVVGANGGITIDLKYGVIRIPIFPLKKKTKKNIEEKPVKKKTGKPKKTRFAIDIKKIEYRELIDMALDLLDEFSGTLRFSDIRIKIIAGTTDAATTGLLYGEIFAIVGIFIPILENNFDMKDYQIFVDTDFDADHTEWAFRVFASIRPIQVTFALLKHAKEYYRFYQKIKKEEATENE